MTVLRRAPTSLASLVALLLLLVAPPARAADPVPGPGFTIRRAAGAITVDGDLSDPGWQGIEAITTWYETNPGDNIEPKVKNEAYLTYDDHYFYAAFRFEDPKPAGIRGPIGDHDAVPSSTDYAGVIVDTHNDGKTAQMFLANPHGVQYDAISSDATGEDNSPDFFWDSEGKTTATGWTLEIRIPFSSLRYANEAEPRWRILLYRNYPRDRRYQFFTARLPRDVNCFICNSSPMSGLAGLPHGSHMVVAPFVTAQRQSFPVPDLGDPLHSDGIEGDAGVDLKWSPATSVAIDATVNPDFSQVESDVAQIVANERFALFFPEKRPFFLEGVDLLATPIQAVYTRTVTDPQAGLRATGKIGDAAYTALITRDQGGGRAVLPGPQGSSFVRQDFDSDVGILRLRHDLGRSFVSFLATGRSIEDQGIASTGPTLENSGHNVVLGPDFQWRPRGADSFTGQALWSQSRTPMRTDLTSVWDGRTLSDHALQLSWSHGTRRVDWYLQGQDFGPDFRADDGFVPQVGYREIYGETGYTIRPKDAFLSRVRFFTANYYDVDPDGHALNQHVSIGSGGDGGFNSFYRVELNHDKILVGTAWLERFRPHITLQANPGRVVNQLSTEAFVAQEIDFDNARRGRGLTLLNSATVRPSDHLELRANVNFRRLDVNGSAGSARLFTAQVERVRAQWSFSSRSFVRLIGQYQQTRRDTSLYSFAVPVKEADFNVSGLFAFKLNWQTVAYAGYGDSREFDEVSGRLEKSGRQAFTKISYAWQR